MIFGIETSSAFGSLALVDGSRIVAERRTRGQVRHSEAIFELARKMIGRHAKGRKRISGIAVSIGPGMFTSLRVGLALGKGLAMTLGVPVVAVNSLDALALSVTTPHPRIAPVVDAGRGDIYVARYRKTARGLRRSGRYHLIAAPALGRLIRRPTLVLGPGIDAFRGVLEAACPGRLLFLPANVTAPRASLVARLGAAALDQGMIADLARLEPFYIKEPDAITGKNRKTERR